MGANWTKKTWAGWSLAAALALIIAYGGLALISCVECLKAHMTISHQLAARPLATYLHFIFGPVALATGIFQMLPQVRARRGIHRWLGRVYAVSCVLSATGGIWLALYTTAGLLATAGFISLGLLWLWTTLQAWRHARARDFAAHRKNMLLSYSLTFGAVTLRLQVALVMIFQLDFAFYYPIISFSAWVPNILVMMWWLRREQIRARG